MKKLTTERFGLVLIFAALVVIGLITGLLIADRHASRKQAVLADGANLARLLSKLPYAQLVPEREPGSVAQLVSSSQGNPDFAYIAIVAANGTPLAVTAAHGTIVPEVSLSGDQSLWLTEHALDHRPDGRGLLEFRAPIVADGHLGGYVRVGYFQPTIGFDRKQLSFLAEVALPIFLLVPLTYLLIHRQIRPLQQASVAIKKLIKKQEIHGVEVKSTGELHDFMQNFKRFVEIVDERFNKLQDEQFKSQVSSLTLGYQRRRIESALQSLPDAVLVMDETGMATFANSKLAPLIGVTPEGVLGLQPHEWCENTEIIALLAKYHSNVSRLHRTETVQFSPEHNPEKTVAVSAYPLFTPKDTETICGTLVIFHDQTKAVMAEQARDDFISHVAHELKSPLNVIHMYAETLLDPGEVAANQRIEMVNVINDEVERLSTLITNLLNITKIEAGSVALDRQRVKPVEFLEDTFNSVARGGMDSDIKFDLQLPRDMDPLNVDKSLLRVALNNLLTNAVKYNRPGGSVTLMAEESDHALSIRISDTGIGIGTEDQKRIFDKFYRSEQDDVRERSGHGLGLALAKDIIDLHHGSIAIESALGEGTTFTIELKKTATILKKVI